MDVTLCYGHDAVRRLNNAWLTLSADNDNAMQKTTVLITGGNIGIGLEFAKVFAQRQANLVLVSENKAGLTTTAEQLASSFPNIIIWTKYQDLTTQDGPEQVRHFLQQKGIEIDILINNAGIGSYGFYHQLEGGHEQKIIELNVLALHRLTHLLLPMLLRSPQAGLINIASIAAFQPVPSMATYAATKSFVLHFTKAIRAELKEAGHSIKVLAVCPSGTRDTGFQHRAGMDNNPLFHNFMSITPDQVAKRAVRAYDKNKAEVIVPWWLDLLSPIIRRLPRKLLIWQARITLKP